MEGEQLLIGSVRLWHLPEVELKDMAFAQLELSQLFVILAVANFNFSNF